MAIKKVVITTIYSQRTAIAITNDADNVVVVVDMEQLRRPTGQSNLQEGNPLKKIVPYKSDIGKPYYKNKGC